MKRGKMPRLRGTVVLYEAGQDAPPTGWGAVGGASCPASYFKMTIRRVAE